MQLKIDTLIAVNNCILVIYSCSERKYRFSVASQQGKAYTCESTFPTGRAAKSMGIAVVERFSCKP